MNPKLTLIIGAKDKASQVLKGLGGSVAKLGKIAAVGFGGFTAAAAGATTAIMALANSAAKRSVMKPFFWKTFSDSSTNALQDLRDASKGTVSDMDLMQSANRAALLGVADSTEELAGLMTTARLRGKAMGLTTTQAFEDIVTGIGRGSPLILDNLGIKIPDAMKEMMKEMDETEKMQTLLNFAIEDGAEMAKELGGDVLDTADKFAILRVNAQNLKQSIGDAFSGIAGVTLDMLNPLIDKVGHFLTIFAEGFAEATSEIQDALGELGEAFGGLLEALGITQERTDDLASSMGFNLGQGIANVIEWVTDLVNTVTEKIPLIKDLFNDVKVAFDNVSNSDLVQNFKKWISNLIPSIKAFGNTLKEQFLDRFDEIKQVWNNDLKPAVKELVESLSEAFGISAEDGDAFITIIGKLGGTIANQLVDFIKFGVTVVSWILKMSAFFIRLGTTIYEWGQNAIQRFNEFILFIKSLPSTVSTVFTNIGNKISEKFTQAKDDASSFKDRIVKFFTEDIPNGITRGLNAINTFFQNLPNTIVSGLNRLIGNVESAINSIIDGYNKAAEKLPAVNTIGKVSFPRISARQFGGLGGGTTLVGEAGVELLELPAGSNVRSAQSPVTQQASGATVNVTFTGDVRMDSPERVDELVTKIELALGNRVNLDLIGG